MARLATPIFYHAYKQFFDQFLIFANLYQQAKAQFFICSFMRYSQFKSPVTTLTTLIFDHAIPKNFQSAFNWLNL